MNLNRVGSKNLPVADLTSSHVVSAVTLSISQYTYAYEYVYPVKLHTYTYRVSNKKSYSSFWLVFKNACAILTQTYHGHSLKDGKNNSHKSKQLGRVTTSGMRLA